MSLLGLIFGTGRKNEVTFSHSPQDAQRRTDERAGRAKVIVDEVEHEFPVESAGTDDRQRNEFLRSVSRAIDERVGDISVADGLLMRNTCHDLWNERHPDMQMFVYASVGREYGKRNSRYDTDIVRAYQPTIYDEEFMGRMPDPSKARLICQVTGEDVTDEIHHVDFVRRQTSEDAYRYLNDDIRFDEANFKIQDERYEAAFDPWKRERHKQTGKRKYLDAPWHIPLETRPNTRRCWEKIHEEFFAAHPTLRLQEEELVMTDAQRQRLQELRKERDDADRRCKEVMAKYGYQQKFEAGDYYDLDSEGRILREQQDFSEWLARTYWEGDWEDTEFDPVSGEHFRPH